MSVFGKLNSQPRLCLAVDMDHALLARTVACVHRDEDSFHACDVEPALSRGEAEITREFVCPVSVIELAVSPIIATLVLF